MNILWIFHLILKCINVHLTLSLCPSVFYSELVKQVVAGMLGSVILPLIFKYSISLGLQIKGSLLNTDTFSMIDFTKCVDFSYTVLPLCVSTLAFFSCSFAVLLSLWSHCLAIAVRYKKNCTLQLVTNCTDRKFWIWKIKYVSLETVTKAFDHMKNP